MNVILEKVEMTFLSQLPSFVSAFPGHFRIEIEIARWQHRSVSRSLFSYEIQTGFAVVAFAPRYKMPWYAPWSDSIKKRACRYLLQRYLGQFLEEKLTLDQLSVDLYDGTGVVERLALDCQASARS